MLKWALELLKVFFTCNQSYCYVHEMLNMTQSAHVCPRVLVRWPSVCVFWSHSVLFSANARCTVFRFLPLLRVPPVTHVSMSQCRVHVFVNVSCFLFYFDSPVFSVFNFASLSHFVRLVPAEFPSCISCYPLCFLCPLSCRPCSCVFSCGPCHPLSF